MSIKSIKQILRSNLLSVNTTTYRTGVNPIRQILLLPVLLPMFFVMYGFALLIGDEKAITGFEMMFELMYIFGIAVLLMFAGIGIFAGLVTVIYPMYLRINKIVKTPQQVEYLRKKIEIITDNKQQSNKILNLLYQVKDHINEDPPDAKIHSLENKCEQQKWEIQELKYKNKKLVNESKEKSIKIIKLEKGLQNTNTRLDKLEIKNKEKFEAISDKIHSKNNSENTEMIDKSNKDEIID